MNEPGYIVGAKPMNKWLAKLRCLLWPHKWLTNEKQDWGICRHCRKEWKAGMQKGQR
jgi:hypothetical protein